MSWPIASQYQDAVLNPQLSFDDPDLKGGKPELDAQGFPRARSGQFACVFRLHGTQKDWAVKCFTQEVRDLQGRYAAIDQHLSTVKLSYMVGFDYLSKGICVLGQWYPILKMEWVQGELLNQYIEHHLNNASDLRQLASLWIEMINALHTSSIAHGDLQERNVFVVNGQLRLVDYDGMYVPALSGRSSNEIGQSNYQHPLRTEKDFGPSLDNFSAWVIYVSLAALAIDPSLWARTKAGDERLLFKKADFEQPLLSPTFALLTGHRNPNIQALGTLFRSTLSFSPLQVPSPDGQMPVPVTPGAISPSAQTGWWQDHAGVQTGPVAAPETLLGSHSSSPPFAWILDFMQPSEGAVLRTFSRPLLLPRLVMILSGSTLPLASGLGILLPGVFPAIVGDLSYFLSLGYLLILLSFGLACLDIVVAASCYSNEPAVIERNAISTREKAALKPLLELERSLDGLKAERDLLQKQNSQQRRELENSLRHLQEQERKEVADAQTALKKAIDYIDSRKNAMDREEKEAIARIISTTGHQVSSLKQQIDSLVKAEADEVASRLYAIQKQILDEALRRHPVSSAPLAGLRYASRSTLVSALLSHGIRSAYDISYARVDAVPGFGPKRTQMLVNWRDDLVHEIKWSLPRDLEPAVRNEIKARYQAQRTPLEHQRNAEQTRFASEEKTIRDRFEASRVSLRNEQSTAQAQTNQKIQEINRRFGQQYLVPTEALGQLEGEFKPKYQEIDEKANQVRQRVFQASWEIARIRREYAPYRSISFPRYLKKVFLGQFLK